VTTVPSPTSEAAAPTTVGPTTAPTEAPTTSPPATDAPTTAAPTTAAPTTEAPTTAAPTTAAPTTEAPTTAAPTTTTPPAPTSSGGGLDWWVWLLIALAVAGLIAALVAWLRRRSHARAAWTEATGRAVRDGKVIVDQASTGQGDLEPTLQRQLQGLDATLASLQTSAPSQELQQQVYQVRGVAAELGAALQTDLRVRIGPPSPTDDQLQASHAQIVQRARDLDTALDRLGLATAQK
jgi:hypothetical protein